MPVDLAMLTHRRCGQHELALARTAPGRNPERAGDGAASVDRALSRRAMIRPGQAVNDEEEVMDIREMHAGMKFRTAQGILEIVEEVEQAGYGEYVIGELNGHVDFVAHNELDEKDLIET